MGGWGAFYMILKIMDILSEEDKVMCTNLVELPFFPPLQCDHLPGRWRPTRKVASPRSPSVSLYP